MLSVFSSCFKTTCNATCFSRKMYYIWFLLLTYNLYVFFPNSLRVLPMGAYLPICLTVRHNLKFLWVIPQLQGFPSTRLHIYKLKSTRKFKPDLMIITYFFINSQAMVFRSFTNLHGKSYLGQPNYLVWTTTRFQVQKLESWKLVFIHVHYCPQTWARGPTWCRRL